MVIGNTGRERDFDIDEMVDPDDIDYDDYYGRLGADDDAELKPLGSDRMRLSLGDIGGKSGGDRKEYSAINFAETQITFHVLYDFLRYVPKNHNTRMLIDGLVRFSQQMFNAPAMRRRLRFEEYEAQAMYWEERANKIDAAQIKEADQLLSRWSAQDLLQVSIRARRLRHGLEAVEHERARWHTATRKKEILEEMATRLSTPAFEYFGSRMEQYRVIREAEEDRARGIAAKDLSELIKRIASGEAKPAEVIIEGPWPLGEALEVAVQDVDINNPHWDHIRQLQAATARAQARRRRWGRRDKAEDGDDD